MAPKKGELLARVNFPPYTVRMLTNRHILVAGGGGQAKTGIANAIEIYELSYDGSMCRAQPTVRYETGSRAIMNCTTFHNGRYYVLAAGMEGSCQLYQIKFQVYHCEEDDMKKAKGNKAGSNTLRRRKSELDKLDDDQSEKAHPLSDRPSLPETRKDKNRNSVKTTMGFSIQPLTCIQTDFCTKDDPFQKVVRAAHHFNLLLTGGADGHIRIWQYPEMKELHKIEAHKDEIDDLDISPTAQKIVTVSRDGHAYVWKVKDGGLVCELLWTPPSTEKYKYRNCRFGIVEGDKVNACLFTSMIPVVPNKKSFCYLQKWDMNTYKVQKYHATGTDINSSLAISDDGRFLALGTMSGNVEIYIAFSLQRLLHVEGAHNIFVTGLEFVPNSEDMEQITGDYDASVISISVDNQIKIHHIPKQTTISIFWLIAMFFVALFFIFTLMSYFEL